MKSSIIIVLCFLTGVLLSYFQCIPAFLFKYDYSIYILPIMMFFVGMSIGADLKSLVRPIRQYKSRIILIPLSTIAGTLLACLLLSFFMQNIPLRETVAIGSGFGYYSLSAIFLTQLAGSDIGMMALISNMTREIFALLAIPLLAHYCGKLAPIAAAGATSIDTTLPIISQACGKDYVVISVFHGIIVDISVPVIISLLYL